MEQLNVVKIAGNIFDAFLKALDKYFGTNLNND